MSRVRYEGEAVTFKYGKKGSIRPQGQGTMTYLDGSYAGCRYEGDFLGGDGNGFFHGQGKWYRPDNTLEYDGELSEGFYHGRGMFVCAEDSEDPGCRYEGEFSEGDFHGQGKWYRRNGTLEYDGELSKGLYHGRGRSYHPDGTTIEYEGEFSEFAFDGQGTLYNPDGSIQRQGRWAAGEPEDSTPSSAGDDSSETGS